MGSVTSTAYLPPGNCFGSLKASPDGSQLVLAPADGFDGVEDYLIFVLMDFDRFSGSITASQEFYSASGENTYGAAFSPDGSKLYRSRLSNSPIIQYNLQAGSTAAILASATPLGLSAEYGDMQVGPDGKIYVAESGAAYLHVINRPDSLGSAAFFQYDEVFLGGRTSNHALPDYPSNLYKRSCQYVEAPTGLGTIDNGLTLEFNWDAISNTEGCQLRGRLFSSTAFAYRNIPVAEADQLVIPWSILAPGEIYLWQVRCACSIAPLDLTDWSFIDIFASPLAKSADLTPKNTVEVYPNPANDQLTVRAGKGSLTIFSITGEELLQVRLAGAQQMLALDDLPSGIYLMEFKFDDGTTDHRSLVLK